ncbi:MAG: hypothetical protein GF408_05830 [Candidatus Omnitrophica bacterium]|nr:hypothetical protein [Candidatus Omnitrophota bacterium]
MAMNEDLSHNNTMKRMLWWGAITLYLGVVYSTLSIGPDIWDGINAALGGKALGVLYLLAILALVAVVYYMEEIKKEKRPLNYMIFFFLAGLFFFIISLHGHPAEKVHMAEYGLLAVLVYNALKLDMGRYDSRLYILGGLICSLAGLVDEIIQWYLPNRYFDWRDVGFNVAGALIALAIIRFNILKGPEKRPESDF